MNFQKIGILICFFSAIPLRAAPGAKVRCQKEAEAIGISETKKRGNMPKELLSIANPTEMDGKYIVVYVGAHAGYNYFKMDLDSKCKLIKIIDSEYAP